MAHRILAASQVASTVSNLKSRYYKYLETLCQSNGIDIANLKAAGREQEILEMFFGGLPVLIGLKYFERLRVLKLFAQDIVNLKPLIEVSGTLEELWICEGPIKCLDGLESCVKIRKLYLYDCQIENGTPIGGLKILDTLWIMNNRLKDFSFLDELQFLAELYIGGAQFSDRAARSVEKWSPKLQTLDIGGNSLNSYQSLLRLPSCGVIRYLTLISEAYPPSNFIEGERQLSWIFYHFPYLERFNNDQIDDKLTPTYIAMAEMNLHDAINKWWLAKKLYLGKVSMIEHNFVKIQERLSWLSTALANVVSSVPKKEGRRNMVIRWQEESQKSLKKLKRIKKNCLDFEFCFHMIIDYYIPSWQLENGKENWPRILETYEKRLLEHSFKWFNSKTGDFSVIVHWGFTFLGDNQIRKHDVEKLFLFNRSVSSLKWDLRAVVGICDRRDSGDFGRHEPKILKDISKLYDEVGETNRFVMVPLVKAEKYHNKFKFASEHEVADVEQGEVEKEATNHMTESPPIHIMTNEEKAQTVSVDWSELELAAVCLVEFHHHAAQICLNDLRNIKEFEEKFSSQVKKLKELGIDLKMEKTAHDQQQQQQQPIESNPEIESTEIKKNKKNRKLSEVLNTDFENEKWRMQQPFTAAKLQSLRDPLELTFAYSKMSVVADWNDFQAKVTCLDLSDLSLAKLDIIDQFSSLCCLNIARNKITSLKKISSLNKLIFLDASSNQLTKIDELPELIVEANISHNSLTNVSFCGKLSATFYCNKIVFIETISEKIIKSVRFDKVLTKLNLGYNKLRSLKGMENNKMLELLLLTENQIREKNEIDILSTLPKLAILDMTGNPVMETEGFLKKVLLQNPNLMSVNCERIQNEERRLAIKKAGKALTMDYIEKHVFKIELKTSLILKNHELQTIALDRAAVAKLQHIELMDLSWNSLENSNELAPLCRLTQLILAHNSMNTLAGESLGEKEAFINLEFLDLSYNHITSQALYRLGITRLPKLKKLCLAGNQINRLDLAAFDLKELEELDLSQNEIKSIKKKTVNQLRKLDLSWNRLKDIDGLSTPNLLVLNITNNKITTCSAIKFITQMPKLHELNCVGNPVTERRVYTEFVKNQAKVLEILDGQAVNSIQPVLKEVKVLSRPTNGITVSKSMQNFSYLQGDQWNNTSEDFPPPLYLRPSEILVNEEVFKQKPINSKKMNQRKVLSPLTTSISQPRGDFPFTSGSYDEHKFFISGIRAVKHSKFC